MRSSASHATGRATAPPPPPWSPWVSWADARREALKQYRLERGQRHRVSLAELRLAAATGPAAAGPAARTDWALEDPFYMPDHVRHIIRLDGSGQGRVGGRARGELPALALPAWRDLRDPRGARTSDHAGPWHLTDHLTIHLNPQEAGDGAEMARGAGRGGGGGAAGWEQALRVAPLLAALLSLLLLLLRFGDNGFKSRRHSSAESLTPNEFAANQDPVSEAGEHASAAGPAAPPGADPPPPYSLRSKPREEPPPPYSTCYVTFSNDNDGVPCVQFYNNPEQGSSRDRSEDGGRSAGRDASESGTDTDRSAAASTSTQTTRIGGDANEQGNAFTHLVFENGRIIETNLANNSNNPPGQFRSNTDAENSGVNCNDLTRDVEPGSEEFSCDERLRLILA